VLLGVLVVVGVFGFGGYAGFYVPYSARQQAALTLEDEIADRLTRHDQVRKDRERWQATQKRSLPADVNDARHGYEAAITQILRDARVPSGTYSVKAKPVDGKVTPEIAPKKPAFTRIGLEVTLKPVDYATLIDVLQRYYRLNLLQQITKFTVKKTDASGTSARRSFTFTPSYSGISDRADLDVTFLTEAIILDGAETRKSLLPIPNGAGAAAGAPGYAALFTDLELTRDMNPLQLAPVLALAGRDYSQLLMKDIFHGPPPPPPPAPKDPPAVVKDDTSKYIRLSGVSRNSDGTGMAIIEDGASKQEYWVELSRKNGGPLKSEVTKHYFTIRGARKQYAPEPDLNISDATSGTARKFKVIGLDGDSLVLAEKGGGPGETTKMSLTATGPGGKRPLFTPKKSTAPPVPPAAAVVGGVAAAAPEEKVFVWHSGDSLSKVKELSRTEAQQAIERATGGLPDPTRPTTPTVPVTETKPDVRVSADGG
jgi:hypothetical protein